MCQSFHGRRRHVSDGAAQNSKACHLRSFDVEHATGIVMMRFERMDDPLIQASF
jgi:hypothetical protein